MVTDGRHWEIYDTYKPSPRDERPIVQFDLKNASATEVCKRASMMLQRRNVLKKYNWQPISELTPQPNSRPVRVRFPDSLVIPVESWRSLLVEVAGWLIKGKHLKKRHRHILCKPNGRTHYAVSTEPVHSSGKPFASPVPIRSFYVEANGGSEYISIACRTIIEHVGQNPARFKVWFSPPRTKSAPL